MWGQYKKQEPFRFSNYFEVTFTIAAERFALPACGRAWILLGSRKNSKRGKCSKMPQNPTRQVHALLGGFVQDALINNQNHNQKTDKIIARTLFFSKNQKNCDLQKRLQKKDFAKLTRMLILENLTLPKTATPTKATKFYKLNLPETLL